MVKRTLFAAGGLVLVCTPAMAADFAPAVDMIVETVAMIIATAVGSGLLWLIAKASAYLQRHGIKLEQEALNAAAGRLQVGLERKLRAEIRSRIPGSLDVNAKHEVVARMADYVAKQLPDTIKALGMDRDNVKRLSKEMVDDYLGKEGLT
ncbi:hypothetical protein ATO13_21921 [Stappia sp. 22II-S9-Z10]|nr:hypothetical protein ATO13_21921 [Stappia sp. 22II-S9-Z10]